MAFGQPSGPPATHRQIQDLLELLQAAGHSDFRDARGPMGFTQRQGNGKFTRDEADAFIEQLQSDVSTTDPAPAVRPTGASAEERRLRTVPSELLAAELQRRGWAVLEP